MTIVGAVDGPRPAPQCKKPVPSERAGACDEFSPLPGHRAAMSRWAAAICGLMLWALLGPAVAADRTPEILAFGDSITAGFGLPSNEAFPARLEARLLAQGI